MKIVFNVQTDSFANYNTLLYEKAYQQHWKYYTPFGLIKKST